jgi:hypothetical protein
MVKPRVRKFLRINPQSWGSEKGDAVMGAVIRRWLVHGVACYSGLTDDASPSSVRRNTCSHILVKDNF